MTIRIQPADIAALRSTAETLEAMCGDDEQLFHDMLTGETDVDRLVLRVHEQLARDAEMIAGIAERQDALKERKARISARHDAGKMFIGRILRLVKLSKLELPEVTYSVRDGKPTIKVVDPDAVPDQYRRIKYEPDKTAINEAFADDEELPNWLVRDLPRDVVTSRTR